jgi:hypothetical protein
MMSAVERLTFDSVGLAGFLCSVWRKRKTGEEEEEEGEDNSDK